MFFASKAAIGPTRTIGSQNTKKVFWLTRPPAHAARNTVTVTVIDNPPVAAH
jgi:hypothetical protein